MKLRHLFAAFAVTASVVACAGTVSAATPADVIVPEFNVVVNGRYVENDYRQYPFILYKDITYFPMTYHDCAYLGVQNDWTPEEGNIITTSDHSLGEYDDRITPKNNRNADGRAYIAEGAITVNGISVDNANEEYPILNYRDVLYFPLTWDWCQAFGWNIGFDSANGLGVASSGFENNGYMNYYYSYKNNYSGYIKSCHISEKDQHSLEKSASYSYSPNHYRSKTYFESDYVNVYSLDDLNYLSVYKPELEEYLELGWYTYEQIEQMFLDKFETDKLIDIETSINKRILNNIPYTVEGKKRIEELLPLYRQNYISVFNYNLTAEKTIPKDQIDVYKNVGWYTYDQFAIDLANSFASQGLYEKAVTALSFAQNGYFQLIEHSYTIPYELHDTYYDTIFAEAGRVYATPVFDRGCPLAVTNHAINTNASGTKQANIVLVNVSHKDIEYAKIRFTCYDASGTPTHDYTYTDRSVITVDTRLNLGALQANLYIVSLPTNKNTAYAGDFVIDSVIFTDGTAWSR